MKKTINIIFTVLIVSIITGYLLIVVVFALPFSWSTKCREKTVEILYKEGLYPADSVSGRHIDNWADSYSLLIASYDEEESPFVQAADAYYMCCGYNPYEWLSGQVTPDNNPLERISYSRYWHGYLLILRPLMSFLDFGQIRMVNKIFSTVLILILLLMMIQKMPNVVVPFLLSLFILAPSAIGECLEYSGVFNVMLLMCLAIVGDWKRIRSQGAVPWLFLTGGILTAYVDFLSAPTLSLSIPIIFLCICRKDEKRKLHLLLMCVLFWGIGYIGMWAGKWVVASLFQRRAFLDELYNSMRQRVSATDLHGGVISRTMSLKMNYGQVFSDNYINTLLAIYGCLIVVVDSINCRQITAKSIKTSAFLFLFPATVSIFWYFVFTNHSVVHFWLHSYRSGVPPVFGLLCALDLRDNRMCQPQLHPEQIAQAS